jgi:hypothetical protein
LFHHQPSAGEIINKDEIDYEEMSILRQLEYRVKCYVNDGYVESDVETFTLRINDDNEPPKFQQLTRQLTQPNEGDGSILHVLVILIFDRLYGPI